MKLTGSTLLLCAMASVSFCAEKTPDTLLLQAGTLAATFDLERNGGIVSLKNGDVDVVAPGWAHPTLFAVEVVRGGRAKLWTSADFKSFAFNKTKSGGRFAYEALPEADLKVAIIVESEGDSLSFRVEAECGPETVCASLLFPYVSGYESLSGDPREDRYLLPELTGEWLLNPARQLSESPTTMLGSQGYPGSQGVQMHSLHTSRGGILMYSADTECRPKRHTLMRNPRPSGAAWTAIHYFDETPGFVFKPSYDVRVQACGPSWYDAADIYAAWGRQQPWMHKVRPRPEWLDSMPPIANVFDNSDYNHGEPAWFVQHQPEMNALLGNRPLINSFGHWERYGYWIAPDSFPPLGGETSMIEAAQTVRGWGNHLLHMFSCGQRWLHQDITPEIFDERIMRGAAWPRQPFDKQSLRRRHDFIGEFVRACPSSPEYQADLVHYVEKLAEYNHDFISMDIWPLGQPVPCFNPGHDHPPGLGKWYVDANLELLKRLHQTVHASQPEAIFGGESMAEPYLPYAQVTLMRSSSAPLDRGPGGRINFLRIPLFDYIYGDQVVEWSDWAMTELEQAKGQIALQFVRGNLLNIQDKWHHRYADREAMGLQPDRQPEDPFPKLVLKVKLGGPELRRENLAFAARLNDIQQGEFNEYFARGRGWRQPKSQARAQGTSEWRPLAIYDTAPAVAALRHPEGDSVLWAIANGQNKPTHLRLAPIDGKTIGRIWPERTLRREKGTNQIEIDLQRLDVLLVEWK